MPTTTFPKLLSDPASGRPDKLVNNADEEAKARADGYTVQAPDPQGHPGTDFLAGNLNRGPGPQFNNATDAQHQRSAEGVTGRGVSQGNAADSRTGEQFNNADPRFGADSPVKRDPNADPRSEASFGTLQGNPRASSVVNDADRELGVARTNAEAFAGNPRTNPLPPAGSGQPNAAFVNPDAADAQAALLNRAGLQVDPRFGVTSPGDVHTPAGLPFRDAANQGAGPYQENAPGRSTYAVPPSIVMPQVPTSGKFSLDDHNLAMSAIAAQQLRVQAETDKLNLMRGQFALYRSPEGN